MYNVLKGYNTVITDGKDVYINTTGNSKMASGGTGDVLTGIIVSLLAQRIVLWKVHLLVHMFMERLENSK